VFRRVVLVPVIESESCPKGVEAQQLAESICDEMLERASGAVGMMIGVSQDVEYLCQTRSKLIRITMAQDVPNLDGRCMKNYALLVSFAEKVICDIFLNLHLHYLSKICTCDIAWFYTIK
jgi:chemotaxis regulatin CheY-phosphate phosphatase CheZ